MKEGLDYFPFPVTLSDEIELVDAEFGHIAIIAYVALLQKIYGGRGYYCIWNTEVALLFSRRWAPAGGSAVSECVSAMIKRGIFDQSMFERYGILTSREIQEIYLESVKRRKLVKINRRYLLVDCAHLPDNVYIFEENADISRKNADIFQQSKESKESKDSRVKERKESSGARAAAPARYGTQNNVFLTEEQYRHLKEIIPCCDDYIDRFSEKLIRYSYKPKEHYQVILKWWEKDKNQTQSGNYRAGVENASTGGGSFDTDEFFETAVKKSLERHLRKEEAKKK